MNFSVEMYCHNGKYYADAGKYYYEIGSGCMIRKESISKDWKKLHEEYESWLKIKCIPTDIKRLSKGYITNEELSVRRNRELVEENNNKYDEEVTRLNKLKNQKREEIMNKIYDKIISEASIPISRRIAIEIWNKVYSEGHSEGWYSIENKIYEYLEFIEIILKIERKSLDN